MRSVTRMWTLSLVFTGLLGCACTVWAHPGSGIAITDDGVVYFTDTGKGLWRLSPQGEAELVSDKTSHWMGLDRTGAFADAPESFGRWFERATPRGEMPAVVECSDFPMAIGPDGHLYYADTVSDPTVIRRRTPAGKESVVATLPPSAEGGPRIYVTGLTVTPDGVVYVLESDPQHDFVLIRRIDHDGSLHRVAADFVPGDLPYESRPTIAPSAIPEGQPVPMSARSYCRGLFVDTDGTIYVAANGCQRVLAVAPDGAVRVVLHSEPPYSPTDVTVANGAVYVLEYDHTGEDRLFWTPRVRKVTADGTVSTLATIRRE